MNWTPGEWSVYETEMGACWVTVENAPIVATCDTRNPFSPEQRANAQLLSAAPDLYAALEDMLSGWRYVRNRYGDLSGVGWDRAEDAARIAIAKARGESA